MDDLLPSYESAIEQDPWIYIANHFSSETLCSAALVCRKWHAIMTPLLWGKPASHFGVQNDTVYVALTRFKRTLPYVRPHIRALTHTLEFPPAHAELYGGPHAEWLRDCLEYLPRLQCLVVDGLPFFDHGALLSLRYSSTRMQTVSSSPFPVFGLRLLDASACSNATSTGLAEALPHFPDLVSLDLSQTMAARDSVVLSKLQYLRNLRVLNLRGIGLKDADFEIVAQSIVTRVRSLDVSGNHLTDASARLLLDHCIKDVPLHSHRPFGPRPPVEHGQAEEAVVTSQQGSLVSHLRKKLTGGFVGSLAIEEARDVGVTHLYLSNNSVAVEGISGLLRSQRLQVLDVGVLPQVWERPGQAASDDPTEDVWLPSVSKLAPILAEFASTRLEYLRINHEIVTKDAPKETFQSPRVELAGDPGQYRPEGAQELEQPELPPSELDATTNVIMELPGDESFAVEMPVSANDPASTTRPISADINDKVKSPVVPAIQLIPEPQPIKKGPAFAPEPVMLDSPSSPSQLSPYLHEHGAVQCSEGLGSVNGLMSPTSPLSNERTGAQLSQASSRHNSMYFVEDRRAKLELRQNDEPCLHPGMLPSLHTLVLTGVPTITNDEKVVRRIIQFISDAAEEASIARQRARHTYMLPPGRRRAIAEQEYSSSLFALRRIVLEMAAPQKVPKKAVSSWRAYPTKSSTEDADSEAFWEAATYDFSFFDDEECGLPALEPGRALPLTAMSGLEVAPPHPLPEARNRVAISKRPLIDVVDHIGRFRREKKAAYEDLMRMGEVEVEVEGYWPGDITIFRKPVDPDEGELDCYGNRYEAGWYYR